VASTPASGEEPIRRGGVSRRYRPRWLNLAEARAELVAKGFSPSEAEDRLRCAIGDEALGFRLNHGDPDVRYLTSTIGPGWWRNPKLAFEQSTIVVPLPRRPPPMSHTQETLAMVARLREPPAPPIIDEVQISIEVLAEDLDRLWSDDPAPEAAPPASKQQPAAGAKPQPRRHGPEPKELERVKSGMREKFCSDLSKLADRTTWSGGKLARAFKTSRSTANRAREELLSKFDQD